MGSGALYIVATPIGNLGDITLRALETLRAVQVIAAEDTRHTRKLLSHYDIHTPLVSYHAHNAQHRGPELIRRLQAGEDVAVVTDAGTPGISDPGGLLVEQALEAGCSVTVIPGPAAAIAALVSSGLSTHPFAFLGFPPGRGSGRRRFFATYAALPMTLILYESPQRLPRTLDDLLLHWGNRRIAVARELTKRYEEVFRGTVREARDHFAPGVKGELTLVVAGAEQGEAAGGEETDWRSELEELLSRPEMTLREATEHIVRACGLSKRMVYQEALKLKRS